jgi:hypothetical protein
MDFQEQAVSILLSRQRVGEKLRKLYTLKTAAFLFSCFMLAE